MANAALATTVYRFGQFALEPDRRLLTVAGAAVQVSSRGLDLLLLLIERRERVVGKDEIFDRVWPGVVVEENNLAVQISALRRVLGEGPDGRSFIATVPGRGYRFVGAVTQGGGEPAAPVAEAAAASVPAEPPVPAPPPARSVADRRLLIAVCSVVLLAACWGAARWWLSAPAPPRMSIVVMPFRNLGGDPAQDYLADAISDDLTTDLAHLPGSTVIARESADAYKGRAVRAQTIGRELGVRYMLEGSLRAEGPQLHINAQLIDTRDGGHLWASAWDVPRGGLDGARADIVGHLASVLDFHLVQIESARALHERPNNPDALDLFLQARSLLDRDDSLAALVQAQALLERSVAADPGFADGLAELGLVLLRKIAGYDDPDDWRDHARAAAVIAQALRLAPQSALAITARGKLAWEDQQCTEAVPSFQLALSLDADNTDARDGLADCDHHLGRMQSMIDDLRQVIRIDPAATDNAARQTRIGVGYLTLGKLDEAMAWLQQAHAAIADPAQAPAALSWQEGNLLGLIVAAWQSGDRTRAATLFASYRRLCPNRSVWRLASYDTRALAALPGRVAFFAALRAVGMPAYADEDQDFGVAAPATQHDGGDFDPTPLAIPGARRIDTAALRSLVAGTAPVRVLDVGRGGAALPGAVLVWPAGVWGDRDALLRQAAAQGEAAASPARDRPIVVMGDGPLGWDSYDAALQLVADGYRHVLWYRGGEEAWVESGNPVQDRRPE
jgi:TolB-like protein/DNA-binding winged helix-turn-helix (wHTH) protein/tetratricopeptide (TPR) repeat protein